MFNVVVKINYYGCFRKIKKKEREKIIKVE